MAALLFVLLLAPQSISCADIGKVDFANAVIHVNRFEVVKFTGGKACTSDGTDFTKCDWAWSIKEDRTLAPEPSNRVRMLVLNANHRTGSGAWDYVIIFACRNGKAEELIQARYLYGAGVRVLNDREFVVTAAHWRKGDPECCPSRKKREHFSWSPEGKTYILRNTDIVKF